MNLRELSKTLGLSQTTVSRALNGYPEVSEATRARVQQVARENNYTPSSRAKSLATGRAMAIGHVIPVSEKHEMVNPIFGDFIAGAGESYARNGYEMVLSVLDANEQESDVYTSLKSRRAVDGVVVHGPRMADKRIDLLQSLDLPFVVHGRASQIESDYSWLDVNNRSAFRRLTEFLFDLGHRRIALVNGVEDLDFADRRRKGYLDAHKTHGVSPDPALMKTDEMTEDYGYKTASDLLDYESPPTAFVTASVISALGVRRAIEERGLKLGGDVSVVTHDDMLSYLRNGSDLPIFTATRSSVREAGRQLAEILIKRIADPSGPPITTLFEAELVVGMSTGPAPAKR